MSITWSEHDRRDCESFIEWALRAISRYLAQEKAPSYRLEALGRLDFDRS
jgi:hypothetical protein